MILEKKFSQRARYAPALALPVIATAGSEVDGVGAHRVDTLTWQEPPPPCHLLALLHAFPEQNRNKRWVEGSAVKSSLEALYHRRITFDQLKRIRRSPVVGKSGFEAE